MYKEKKTVFFEKLNIKQKIRYGFGIVIVLILGLLIFTYMNFQRVSQVINMNFFSYQVLMETDGLLTSLVDMETGIRGFTITEDKEFLKPFNDGKVAYREHFVELVKLLRKNEDEQANLNIIKVDYEIWLDFEMSILEQKMSEIDIASGTEPIAKPDGDVDALNEGPKGNIPAIPHENPRNSTELIRTGKGRTAMENIRNYIGSISDEQKKQLKINSRELERIKTKTSLIIIIGGTCASLLAILLSFLVALSITNPIKYLINASERIKMHNYLQPIQMKSDRDLEILINNFNAMQTAILVREEKLKKKNEDIKAKMIEIDEANKLKSQFLANMSHELRTPLNSIIGFTSRVIKKCSDVLPPVQLENLKIVKEESHHLLDLINNLLDYSKMEAGKMELHTDIFDLTDVFTEVGNMAKTLIEGKNLKYTQEFYTCESMMINSDKLKIKQIMINLLSNAVKYSEKGIIKLVVNKKNNEYCINLTDEGIGIAAENMENIFDEFRQVDGSYTRKIGGTGLGLSITRKFIEMLGGRIDVSSVIGLGSCFTVFLPANLTELPVAEKETDIMDIVPVEAGIRVVCVDDDPNVHKLYKQYFYEQGFGIIALNGNEDVVVKIAEIMPDLVLLDIMLPRKDGWDILAELKACEKTKDIPVIIVSVLSEKNLAYRMKADEYLVKPVSQEELIECVISTLSKKESLEIFVADDDENFLKFMEQVLSEESIKPHLARDGAELLEMMETVKPDLLLLDIMMPRMDGFDALEEIRKREKWKDIQIIVLTQKDLTNKEKDELNKRTSMVIRKSAEYIDKVMPKLIMKIKEKTYAGKDTRN